MTIKFIFLLTLAISPVMGQQATVRITNATRPAAAGFQIGDRYVIDIVASPRQPISVRTTATGRTNRSPVIAYTDNTGRWSTTGQFGISDFGSLGEVWTVGGKLASPVLQFSVAAPCLPGGFSMAFTSGMSMMVSCETTEGRRSFISPSGEPMRTPDGRLVERNERSIQTAEQYRLEVLESFIADPKDKAVFLARYGDEVGSGFAKIIDDNALTADETRNVLACVRAAFSVPGTVPSATLPFLQTLEERTDDSSLRNQIAETAAFVQSR